MFDKLLIANRGEIACRVIDTCRRLGVATVAVYSDTDRGARHVAMADEAVALGGDSPAESYLRGDAIIAAARRTGAAAIHPGYGFLSENADFADAVREAGLIFVGPEAEAMRLMGRKDAAKAAMAAAGVPVVPGAAFPPGASDEEIARAAAEIGFPVLIKAVAGGGGKGMRRVDNADGFAAALARARSEARAAFVDDAVLIEKFIANARHIEVQVFGDGTRAVHLFERDCSLQRRHQKVLEEAPAPGMTPQMRAAMGEAAVRAAEAVGYVGAGTVEFIVDADGPLRPDGFWFMEMNTRLQVEHPVTEAITGVDLVEWQLQVAAGGTLPCDQAAIAITGHAVEARLYAEDVPAGFLPMAGSLAHLRLPQGVRVETGVRAGDAVPAVYDPMIAKIIAQGPTREAALARLDRALAETEVAGVPTNRDHLRDLLAHPAVQSGQVDTGLIERDAALTARHTPAPEVTALAALAALGLADGASAPLENFALWQPMRWPVALGVKGESADTLWVTGIAPGAYDVQIGEAVLPLRRHTSGWEVAGQLIPGTTVRVGDEIWVCADRTHVFTAPDPLDRRAQDGGGDGTVRAPMPGRVTSVAATPGALVAAGDPLAVVEAMKMEHALCAPIAGRVAAVHATPGAVIAGGDILIEIAPSEAAPAS